MRPGKDTCGGPRRSSAPVAVGTGGEGPTQVVVAIWLQCLVGGGRDHPPPSRSGRASPSPSNSLHGVPQGHTLSPGIAASPTDLDQSPPPAPRVPPHLSILLLVALNQSRNKEGTER